MGLVQSVPRDIWSDFFNTYLILGSRWFSHHEAIEMLLATGRYGDCMVLLRSLLEDTDLITYFGFYPEESVDWMEQLSRGSEWSDRVYRRGIRKFRMRHIWEKLKEKGIDPLGEHDYPVLSATVHASPWGTRFYGRSLPGDPGRLHLSLTPIYDPAATFSIGLVLRGTYPRTIHAFLAVCSAAKVLKSKWCPIKDRYDSLIADWQAKMDLDSWFRTEMASAEQRVLSGEEPDAILQDLRKCINEKFGTADDISTRQYWNSGHID